MGVISTYRAVPQVRAQSRPVSHFHLNCEALDESVVLDVFTLTNIGGLDYLACRLRSMESFNVDVG